MKRILESGEEQNLVVSKDTTGKPVCLSWQTADHYIVEILWSAEGGIPLKFLGFEREAPKVLKRVNYGDPK